MQTYIEKRILKRASQISIQYFLEKHRDSFHNKLNLRRAELKCNKYVV